MVPLSELEEEKNDENITPKTRNIMASPREKGESRLYLNLETRKMTINKRY